MSGIVETLAAAEMRLEVAPELGGRIISLSRGDQTLMRGREEDISLACFAMLPYCNRIASGQFTFQRSRVKLTPNFPGEAHSIHGTGWLASWRTVQQKTDEITLSYQHDAQDIEASGWPWTFNALQTLKLNRHGLKIELSITNTDAQPMPAGLGLHPFFPAPSGTRLFSQFSHELQVDGQGLPVAPRPLSGGGDPLKGAFLGRRHLDNIFTGRKGAMQLYWPDRAWKLTIQPSEQLPHTVIYAPQSEDFICVEPISHIPNILNSASVFREIKNAPMRILACGERLSASALFLTSPA